MDTGGHAQASPPCRAATAPRSPGRAERGAASGLMVFTSTRLHADSPELHGVSGRVPSRTADKYSNAGGREHL